MRASVMMSPKPKVQRKVLTQNPKLKTQNSEEYQYEH